MRTRVSIPTPALAGVRKHAEYARSTTYHDVQSLSAIIIIGRREKLTADQAQFLNDRYAAMPQIKVKTFDDVYDDALRLLANFRNYKPA